METLYKLTDQNMCTYGGFQWQLNEERRASGGGPLCSKAWLHAYTDPIVGLMLNPVHANIPNPRLFRAEGVVGATDSGRKVGCTSLTLLEEMSIPLITTINRVAFAILCAKHVYNEPKWNEWADGWMSGSDRSDKSTAYAAAAAAAADAAAAAADADAAAYAAAAAAADAAAAAAADAAAAYAAAADADAAAAAAADAAAYAAAYAAAAYPDYINIAKMAMSVKVNRSK